jgi:hypothetical protein
MIHHCTPSGVGNYTRERKRGNTKQHAPLNINNVKAKEKNKTKKLTG